MASVILVQSIFFFMYIFLHLTVECLAYKKQHAVFMAEFWRRLAIFLSVAVQTSYVIASTQFDTYLYYEKEVWLWALYIFSCLSPILIYTQASGKNDDFIHTYNRYPETFPKVSVI